MLLAELVILAANDHTSNFLVFDEVVGLSDGVDDGIFDHNQILGLFSPAFSPHLRVLIMLKSLTNLGKSLT